MAKVVDSQLTKDASTDLSPSADFLVQADCEQPTGVYITVYGKIETAASYQPLGSFEATDQPISKFLKLPFVKVEYSGNQAGKNVKIYVV